MWLLSWLFFNLRGIWATFFFTLFCIGRIFCSTWADFHQFLYSQMTESGNSKFTEFWIQFRKLYSKLKEHSKLYPIIVLNLKTFHSVVFVVFTTSEISIIYDVMHSYDVVSPIKGWIHNPIMPTLVKTIEGPECFLSKHQQQQINFNKTRTIQINKRMLLQSPQKDFLSKSDDIWLSK